MDNVQKQRENIVLYKEKRDGQDCIRIEHSNSQAVGLLLAQDTEIKIDVNGHAYMLASTFQLPVFYDRYSPHAYIDYSRVYVRHPKPKREYLLPKGHLELLEQKRYSLSTIKAYKIYFSDFIELLNLTPQDIMIAGIKHRAYLHMLNQSFTTYMFEQGTDLKSIQELMRNNNVKTISIHLYASNAYKAKTPNPLDYFNDT